MPYNSTRLKAHQYGLGPEATGDQTVGKFRGRLSTKLHMAFDAVARLAAGII
jgi:hypothetical protein